jgi:ATP-dependent protease Clp ATPase subunit
MIESSRINVKNVALFKYEGVNLYVNKEAFKYLIDYVLEDRGSTKVRRPIMEHFSF